MTESTMHEHWIDYRPVLFDRMNEARAARVARLQNGSFYEVQNECGYPIEYSASLRTINECLATERARRNPVRVFRVRAGTGIKQEIDPNEIA